MKNTKFSFTKERKKKVTLYIKTLGESFMMPTAALTFAALVLGISFLFPGIYIVSDFLSTLANLIFVIFPMLIYYSYIMTFYKEKDDATLINATIIVFVFIGIHSATLGFINIVSIEGMKPWFEQMIGHLGYYTSYDNDMYEMTPIAMSIFSFMLLAVIFIYIDKRLKNKIWWVVIAAGLTVVLTPLFILITITLTAWGYLISSIPYGIGLFVYGSIDRLLVPIGLHSVLMNSFLHTSAGGTLVLTDSVGEVINVINGDSNIWSFMYSNGLDFTTTAGEAIINGQTYTYEVLRSTNIGQYQQGFLPMTVFAYPILAISLIIRDGWKEGKYFFGLTIVAIITGSTQVVEFAFIFVSPWLYLLNALMFGISYMLLNVLDVSVWVSTAWFVDIILFGLIPSIQGYATHWYWVPIVGISLGVVYSALWIVIQNIFGKTEFQVYS